MHQQRLVSLCSRTGDPGLKKFYTRLKLWWEDASSQCSGHWSRYVCNIGVVELTSLTDSKHLFLNKVRRDVSPLAYECLTQWHRNRTRSSNESNLDFNFYKTLRFVQATFNRAKPEKTIPTKREPRRNVSTLLTTAQSSAEGTPEVRAQEEPKVFASKVSERQNKQHCAFCGMENHQIFRCFKFKKLDLEERRISIRDNGLCFRCLKSGHGAKDCEKVCSKCQSDHHVLIHPQPTGTKDSVDKVKAKLTTKEVVTSATFKTTTQASLGVFPVRISSGSKEIRTFALLDSGSNTTLVKRELVEKLGIKGSPSPFTVNTLGGRATHHEQLCCTIKLLSDDRKESVMVDALTVPDIPIRGVSCEAMSNWPHLAGLELPSVNNALIDLIIGTDCPEMFWTLEERRGGRKEPVAKRTLLGWIIFGPMFGNGKLESSVNAVGVDPLQTMLERMWTSDFLDAKSSTAVLSVNDKLALKAMRETVSIVNGKYQIGIPWRADPKTLLPNNRSVAESRLRMLKRRFLNDPKFAADYAKTLEQYIFDGHAELVSAEESREENQWFLPHHAVFKRSNPEKCRVVFDCAAQYRGISLNDAVFQGPNFLNSLAGVLIRFRKEPVAVVGDITKMFHQCMVLPEDTKYLRFLWWPNGDTSQTAKVHAMKVHLFGSKSSPSVVNFCLRKTADDNEASFSELACDTLRRSFYMDDMLRSVNSVQSAKSLIHEMKELLAKGGFSLTKFMSTEREVIESVPESERAKSLQKLDIEDSTLPQESALGLRWDIEGDFFTYTVEFQEKPATRRGLLATTASLYDPLGLVSPVLLIPKLLQQQLCRMQLDWDDEIPQEQTLAIAKWKTTMQDLSNLAIKRCFQDCPSELTDRELHIFSDASEFAYGAAAYLKVISESGVRVTLVMGKSRVAPIKPISIPRLELTAALVAAKLGQFLKEEFDFKDAPTTYFWTDSMTVLRYLRNVSSRFKVFVAHRVQQIQDLTNIEVWNYVPSERNPADLASRGIDPNDKESLRFWLEGPKFLHDVSAYSRFFEEPQNTDHDLEVRQSCLVEAVVDLNVFIRSFSKLNRLRKACCWIAKFLEHLRGKECSKHITVDEMESVLRALIKYVQAGAFGAEAKAVSSGKPLAKTSSLRTLCPVLKDGLLCVGGRLEGASNEVPKHPIILPRHHLTTLLIRSIHEENAHIGTNQTLSTLRRKYYVLKGYSEVKCVISNCFKCKQHHGKPMEQKMANLPKERVEIGEPPFTNTGVDFFGPLFVKFRRGTAKRYGCLFTCLTTRAVHIELTTSLESDSFIMAFHRFAARRGKPQRLFSDNGTNFVAAERELSEEVSKINDKRVHDSMLVDSVDWKFNPPSAPHMGGAWERLIRSVKSLLRHLVEGRLLTDEELRSFLCEVEKILNDRPLTRMGSDGRDDTPLTPNHLLLLRRNTCASMADDGNEIRRRWKLVQQISNIFYHRFVSEYLPSLQVRSKWSTINEDLQANDVVLVCGEDTQRGRWPLGVIDEVERSSDGLVRAARVRVEGKVKRRPITKLVLLERSKD